MLLTDPIDDFWLSQVKEFSGKNFQSITRGEIDLSSIGDSSKSEEKEDSTVLSEGFIGQIKKSLDNLVSDVRGSKNMETSLARLVNDKDGMDPQMEQMMRIHNPDFVGPPKILEINAKHPLIQSIQKKSETGKLENSSEFARLIFDSALVAEGKTIADPREFSERPIKIMERALLK